MGAATLVTNSSVEGTAATSRLVTAVVKAVEVVEPFF
jgi:hypothetical protein